MSIIITLSCDAFLACFLRLEASQGRREPQANAAAVSENIAPVQAALLWATLLLPLTVFHFPQNDVSELQKQKRCASSIMLKSLRTAPRTIRRGAILGIV